MRVADWSIWLQDKTANRGKKCQRKWIAFYVFLIFCEWARAQSNMQCIQRYNAWQYWFSANISFPKSWLFTKCFSDLTKKNEWSFILQKWNIFFTELWCNALINTDDMKLCFNGWKENFAIYLNVAFFYYFIYNEECICILIKLNRCSFDTFFFLRSLFEFSFNLEHMLNLTQKKLKLLASQNAVINFHFLNAFLVGKN